MESTPIPITLPQVVIISVSLAEETKKNTGAYLKGRALALCLFFHGRIFLCPPRKKEVEFVECSDGEHSCATRMNASLSLKCIFLPMLMLLPSTSPLLLQWEVECQCVALQCHCPMPALVAIGRRGSKTIQSSRSCCYLFPHHSSHFYSKCSPS